MKSPRKYIRARRHKTKDGLPPLLSPSCPHTEIHTCAHTLAAHAHTHSCRHVLTHTLVFHQLSRSRHWGQPLRSSEQPRTYDEKVPPMSSVRVRK